MHKRRERKEKRSKIEWGMSKKSRARIYRVKNIIYKLALDRGRSAEEKAKKALQNLKKKGQISGFFQASKYQRLDREGCDFIVFIKKNSPFHLQIKSSLTGANKHLKRHPDIPVLIIKPEENEENIETELIKIMNLENPQKNNETEPQYS
jgi:hypothetical protein